MGLFSSFDSVGRPEKYLLSLPLLAPVPLLAVIDTAQSYTTEFLAFWVTLISGMATPALYYRAMHYYSAKRGIAIACRPSVTLGIVIT